MEKTCWCYTTDENYLLPTIVSASQLRKNLRSDDGQVVIIYIGETNRFISNIIKTLNNEKVDFIQVSKNILDGFPMVYARLYIDKILGKDFSSMVYLDGDTQIYGDMAALAQAKPRSNSLLAAPDLMSLMIFENHRYGSKHAAYFNGIGINPDRQRRYFNAGVLKVSMADWSNISYECLKLIKGPNSQKLLFKDQDALNIVLNGNHDLLSIRWNWPAFFWNSGIEQIVPPNIMHFMSKPRPWDGPFSPWRDKGNAPYKNYVALNPALKELYKPLTGLRKLKYRSQQLYKSLTEDWSNASLKETIRSFEKGAVA